MVSLPRARLREPSAALSLSRVAGGLGAGIGVAVLVGWVTGSELLRTGLPGSRARCPSPPSASSWPAWRSRSGRRTRDNGIGFDDRHRERIFGIFQRLHTSAEFTGTGIGLAICRKIAEAHGGTIDAHGDPGHGASFRVVLPARQFLDSRPSSP